MRFSVLLTIGLVIRQLATAQSLPVLTPQPVQVNGLPGKSFRLTATTTLDAGSAVPTSTVSLFRQSVRETIGFDVLSHSGRGITNVIRLRIDSGAVKHREGYRLRVTANRIDITGHDPAGVFYGLQSLTQWLYQAKKFGGSLVSCQIDDYPRFGYRGMHLDVSRHFFSMAYLKTYLDRLALYKINTFHWHLTDDQGWRIETRKYPELQRVAAYRSETMIGHKKERPHRFDGKRYGGYYTQNEVRELVRYAAERHITIIPEIEMPGHALAALGAYPQLGCMGRPAVAKPYATATFWGIFDDVFCAGNDSTFVFLQDVLDEVVDLFPSKYIHIGGDECPKTRWKTCPRCQQRIRTEHLADEKALQRYFIRRIAQHLAAKGRQIIGWDEILEGDLLSDAKTTDAVIMSWQGIDGGIAAARQKRRTIMTPESHVYFDYYQSLYPAELVAAAGYTPLSKVYAYEPVPPELTPDQATYIAGVQGNVWSEYLPTEAQADYMIFPRALALAEIAWSQPHRRNYPDFLRRLRVHKSMLDRLGIHYADTFDELTDSVTVAANGAIRVTLTTTLPNATIRYTTSENDPSANSAVYAGLLPITQTETLKAAVFLNGRRVGRVWQKRFVISHATGKTLTINGSPKGNYRPGSPLVLVNGVAGTTRYNTGEWAGFQGETPELTVDLQTEQPVSVIGINVLVYHWQRMWGPRSLAFSVSTDGQTFREVYHQDAFPINGINPVRAMIQPVRARYVRVRAEGQRVIPAGEYGAGGSAWLLLDELVVN